MLLSSTCGASQKFCGAAGWAAKSKKRKKESKQTVKDRRRKMTLPSQAELVGQDGSNLLADLYAAEAPAFLRETPAVVALSQ
jgi:hypothetical protein